MAPSILYGLVGPTASGKGALGVDLCRMLGAEVISLDSVKVYRGLDIASGKPRAELRARGRFHLLDVVDVETHWDLALHLAALERARADIRARNVAAIVVGGTTLYLKALFEGLFEGPGADPVFRAAFRERLAREGFAALHAELAGKDAVRAAQIPHGDVKRLERALEIIALCKGKPSQLAANWRGRLDATRFRFAGLLWPRDVLDRRIEARVDAMFAQGLVDEVRALAPRLGDTARAAIGVKEVLAHLAGDSDETECRRLVARNTRRFARRQCSWYRKMPGIAWFPLSHEDEMPRVREAVAAYFLSGELPEGATWDFPPALKTGSRGQGSGAGGQGAGSRRASSPNPQSPSPTPSTRDASPSQTGSRPLRNIEEASSRNPPSAIRNLQSPTRHPRLVVGDAVFEGALRGWRAAFGLNARELLAIVGGGGKTTLMFTLAHAYAAEGLCVLSGTTTRMFMPLPQEAPLVIHDAALLEEALSRERHVCLVPTMAGDTARGFSREDADRIFASREDLALLIEADGCRGRPFKAWREDEPVIPSLATTVIVVVGAPALAGPFSEDRVFRPELAAPLLGKDQGDTLAPDDAARLADTLLRRLETAHPHARRVAFVNQVEDEEQEAQAAAFFSALRRRAGACFDGYAGSLHRRELCRA